MKTFQFSTGLIATLKLASYLILFSKSRIHAMGEERGRTCSRMLRRRPPLSRRVIGRRAREI